LTLNVTFYPASFSGTKNEYLYAFDGSGVSTGWQQMGTWTVPAPPAPDFTLTTAMDTYYVQTGILSTASYTITVAPQNGFNSPVSFSMAWPMYGCGNPSFNPAQVGGPPWTTTVTMSCYETLQNSYWTTVQASGGGKSHQLYLFLAVAQSQQYFLTTGVSPPGSGAIYPASGWYNNGTQVMVTAAANPGYQFTGFSGSLAGGSPGYLTMNANKSVTANFTQTATSYSLTTAVSPSGGGTVSPSCPGGCSYSSGSQVTITATPANGYQFSGFTGTVNSSSNPLTVTMNSAKTETANFTPVTPSQPLTAAPSSQTVAPTGVAGYAVTVGANAGFNGVVTFGASNLPSGATATFNPATVNTSGTVGLSIATSAASPTGTFPILITAQSAGVTKTTTVLLALVAQSPANMLNPATGSVLTGPAATFSWDTGAGVSQYQLSIGSSPGGTDVYQANTGSARNSTVNLPNSSQPTTLYATLGSLISATWQSRSYTYRIGVGPPQADATAATRQPQATSTNYYVYNDNKPVTLPYCLRSPFTGECDDTFDAGRLSNCTVSGNGVSARLKNVGADSQWGRPPDYDVEFTADRTATPGSRDLTCKWPSLVYPGTMLDIVVIGAVYVYDASPQITFVQQDQPAFAGGPFYVEIYGQNFGSTLGSLGICTAGAPQCNGTPEVIVDFHAPYSYWSDNQVNALLTPSPNASGLYDIQIGSLGANGTNFAPAPQGQTSSGSNRGQVSIARPVTISGTLITSGKGMVGISVKATVNGGATRTVQTDANGAYSFTVSTGDNVTVWPSPPPPYTYPFTAVQQGQGGTAQCQASPPPASCFFYNVHQNEAQNFTPNYITVFLLHGISQGAEAMVDLAASLSTSSGPPTGMDLSRFVIDSGFDFGECAKNSSCTTTRYGDACSISAGGRSLARYIANSNSPGAIVLIGYSMGGLIARDLLARNYDNVLGSHPVRGLMTLGTPNWGYPFLEVDTTGPLGTGLGAKCPQLARDMAGSWNPDNNLPNQPSSFLSSLTNSWGSSSYGGYWLAAAGTYCQSSPYRKLTTSSTGCPWNAPHSYSDGVVCADSASYSDFIPLVTPFSGRPTINWSDSGYVHTTADWGWGSAFVLCGVPANAPELFKPPLNGLLYNQIVQVLNGY
jgi:pimeloyl-ACP methyl ester carboxylesterase